MTPTVAGENRSVSEARRSARGFTLVELLVVIVIIGIIVAMVASASLGSIRTAEIAATQRLIQKLENAVADRMDAILQTRPDPSYYHRVLAHVYAVDPNNNTKISFFDVSSTDAIPNRAYAIALTDYIKAEMPDVFFVQDATANDYPLNFASNPFPYVLQTTPGGVSDPGPPTVQSKYVTPLGAGYTVVQGTSGPISVFAPGQGVFGATYGIAAGLYKNLGYQKEGYDGVDNDGDNQIDNWAEGVNVAPAFTTQNATVYNTVTTRLANHKHATARSEVLYAILVEGSGPWGAVFSRDDFSDKEVMDTDNDGMPEFVDAWGQPLQFYRWPLLFHSDLQKGQRVEFIKKDPTDQTEIPFLSLLSPYFLPSTGSLNYGMITERERDPIDQNMDLMAPAWWSFASNNQQFATPPSTLPTPSPFPTQFQAGGPNNFHWSPGVTAFETYFHSLHEPLSIASSDIVGEYWDRGAPSGVFSFRRAFNTKPLIVSAGPDQQLGLFQYTNETLASDQTTAAPAAPLILLENNAVPLAHDQAKNLIGGTLKKGTVVDSAGLDLYTAGQDDISNHALAAGPGGTNQ